MAWTEWGLSSTCVLQRHGGGTRSVSDGPEGPLRAVALDTSHCRVYTGCIYSRFSFHCF